MEHDYNRLLGTASHWLRYLRPGDQVIVKTGRVLPFITEVTETTATHIKVGETEFDLNGYNKHSKVLFEATPERIFEIEQMSRVMAIEVLTATWAPKATEEELHQLKEILDRIRDRVKERKK